MITIIAESVSFEGFFITDETPTSHRKAVFYINNENIQIINNHINRSDNGYAVFLDNCYNIIIKENIFNNTKGVKILNSLTSTVYGNIIQNCSYNPALYIESSSLINFENNTITKNKYGIHGSEVNDCKIIKNSIVYNTNSGIFIESGKNNSIINNSISNNDNIGIDIFCSESLIGNNSFISNTIGLRISAYNCIVFNNTFSYSSTYGLFTTSVSRYTTIYNNLFLNNIGLYHAKNEGFQNYWNYTNGNGNYWDDFYGPDPRNLNNTIPLNSEMYYYKVGNLIDYHPLGVFNQQPNITDPYPEHLASNISKNPVLRVKVTDPDDDNIIVNFYYYDGSSFQLINKNPKIVSSGETVSVAIDPSYSYIGLGYDFLFQWYVTASDQYSMVYSNESYKTYYIFTTVLPPGDNIPPIADTGGPYQNIIYNEDSGATIQFNGSGCYDYDGTVEFYFWSFGDNETSINIRSPTHNYKNIGEYKVNLVVIDNYGASDTDETFVNIYYIKNEPPKVDISGPSNALVGETFTLIAEVSDPNEENTENIIYRWDFGDTSQILEGNNQNIINYKYSSAGTYYVTLEVEDSEGATSYDTISIIIQDIKRDEESPGFESVLLLISIICLLFIFRNKKRKK